MIAVLSKEYDYWKYFDNAFRLIKIDTNHMYICQICLMLLSRTFFRSMIDKDKIRHVGINTRTKDDCANQYSIVSFLCTSQKGKYSDDNLYVFYVRLKKEYIPMTIYIFLWYKI